MTIVYQRIPAAVKRLLEPNKVLAPYTSWRIGGPAEWYAVPQTIDDLLAIIDYVNSTNTALYILGRGSNVLIDDAGLPGITLHLRHSFQSISIEQDCLRAGAGVPLPKLATLATHKGYSGFEFLAGIPGTVGAGVLINAGAGQEDIRMRLKAVTLLDRAGNLHRIEAEIMHLGYRQSDYLRQSIIVVEAEFHLGECSHDPMSRVKLKDFIDKRRAKFPLNYPNAGSTFKRPADGTGPFAGYLLETAGMKGYRVGGAQVSQLHANFIINVDHATADDVRRLIDTMQRRVETVHGITLQREVIYLPQDFRW